MHVRHLQVVGDEQMFDEWRAEMEMMSGRIKGVRQSLYDELNALMPEKDWSFVLNQIGMFSFTGLSPNQVENMTNKVCAKVPSPDDPYSFIARTRLD